VNEGVRIEGYASHILIAGNVIAFSESNIELEHARDVTADGNFLLNPLGPFPRGQNFQSGNSTNMTVTRNYALSSTEPSYPFPADQEDSINFYYTKNPLAQGNYVTGGVSPSGCAIIADAHTSGASFLGNTVFDSGECGIAISSGSNQTVSGNQVLNLDPVTGGGNVGIYVANYAKPYPCANVTVSNNVVSAIDTPCDPTTQSCTFNSYYADGSCKKVTVQGNTFDEGQLPVGGGAAYMQLIGVVPEAAPLIPPFPHACVAVSPYSTQTSLPRCQ
jgi:parallel beta-helix repeat protein